MGQTSSSTLHIKTEELSRQYDEQLRVLREEKDREIQRLRVRAHGEGDDGFVTRHGPIKPSESDPLQTQITTIQTEVSSSSSRSSSAENSLQLKISELLAVLEQRQTTITRQEEVCDISLIQSAEK